MKNFVRITILLIIIGGIYYYKDSIAKFLASHISTEKKVSDTVVRNQYFEHENYSFVSVAENFYPTNKQDLINIFYTVLNAGMEDFSFYCNEAYKDCIRDIDAISSDRILLSNVNNFVNPYNTFKDIETTRYETSGKIHFHINYTYDIDTIEKINEKIDTVLKEKINDSMNTQEKIKVLHDYIIQNTKYDSLKSDQNINQYQSSTAFGPLFEGYGLCSGYADAMRLFLTKLEIPNIKISSENHIWNLVFFNGAWVHLDLTWDDPVLDSGREIIDYGYYLITTEELYKKDDKQHFFNEEIYKEAL